MTGPPSQKPPSGFHGNGVRPTSHNAVCNKCRPLTVLEPLVAVLVLEVRAHQEPAENKTGSRHDRATCQRSHITGGEDEGGGRVTSTSLRQQRPDSHDVVGGRHVGVGLGPAHTHLQLAHTGEQPSGPNTVPGPREGGNRRRHAGHPRSRQRVSRGGGELRSTHTHIFKGDISKPAPQPRANTTHACTNWSTRKGTL
jgi:hypothetical protein